MGVHGSCNNALMFSLEGITRPQNSPREESSFSGYFKVDNIVLRERLDINCIIVIIVQHLKIV